MTRKEQIKSAYKLTGSNASFYDGMMKYSTFPGKAICRIVWNMDGEKNFQYMEKALAGIPEDFSGKLLEVPVGTGRQNKASGSGFPASIRRYRSRRWKESAASAALKGGKHGTKRFGTSKEIHEQAVSWEGDLQAAEHGYD